MKEINLIASQKIRLFDYYQKAKFFKFAVVVIDCLLVVLMALFLLFYSFTSAKFKSNTTKISLLKSEITKFAENETILSTIVNRAKAAEEILKPLVFKENLLEEVKTLFVPGFTLFSFEVGSENKIVFNGNCGDIQCLEVINEMAENLKQKKYFSDISIEDITKTKSGTYELKATLKK